MHALWHLLQQGRGDLFVGWILGEVNRDEKLLSFCVNIADIDTALMGEEDPVALMPERSASTQRLEVKATMEVKT